ncbi:uncharacterized protein DDB_G0283357-like [Aedes albopictus]|uniref:Uncharacterized protein n=1 Tax=Aedes albopictus TaxID=7160 RepID=A0ABM1XM90_AEDAL
MGDFMYGGSVLTNDSCMSSQSLLDTLSINNLLNIKHLSNGAGVGSVGGGLSPSASEPSSNVGNSSVDSIVDNNNSTNGGCKSGKKSAMSTTTSMASSGVSGVDETGLLIAHSQIASSNSAVTIPTITTAISSECSLTASSVNTLSLQLNAGQSDDDTSTSSLLNGGGSGTSPIASLNSHSNNNNNPNATNNNLLMENSDLHLPSAAEELSLKAADLSCLSVTSSLMNGGSSSHMILPPNGLNFGTAPDHSPWSTSIDDPTTAASSHLSINGLGGFQNYSNSHLYNGAAVAAAAAAAAAQQQRRAITASHGGFPHHGLSPNNPQNHMLQHHSSSNPQSQQPQQSQYKNSYPTWSNPAPTPWSQQQPPQNPQNPMNSWNRGRSVPNMNLGNTLSNPLHPRKPHNSQQQSLSPYSNHLHQSQQQPHLQQSLASNLINSPSKYRRSTSYPAGKSGLPSAGNGAGGGGGGPFGAGPLDCVPPLDDTRDPFLSSYQRRRSQS